MTDLQSTSAVAKYGFIERLEASKYNDTWLTVTFDEPFQERNTTKPIVLAQCQTRNGPDTPGLRLKDVNHTGFKIRYEEVYYTQNLEDVDGPYGSNGKHRDFESVGWVAYLLTQL